MRSIVQKYFTSLSEMYKVLDPLNVRLSIDLLT